MNQAQRDTRAEILTASHLWKHMDIWQVEIAFCWNSHGWMYSSVLIYCIIYRLTRWAKVNTQQLSHLDLNFSLLLWNFTLHSQDIYCHCCVCSVCCVPQINLQFWFFTVNAASLMNGRFHAQHYSFAEEWLEERSEAKGSNARPIFWFAFIQSTSIDSIPLTELLLSRNFAWTKNKSSRTIPGFWRRDALGTWLCSKCNTMLSFATNGVWRTTVHSLAFSSNSPNSHCYLTPIFIQSWMNLCTLQVWMWGCSVLPTIFDLSIFPDEPCWTCLAVFLLQNQL